MVAVTCRRLAAGSRAAGVNSVVAVRVRLIGPVVRVIRAIRNVGAVGTLRAVEKVIRPALRAIGTVRAIGAVGVVIYLIVSVRPAGPARRALVARRTCSRHPQCPTSILVLEPFSTH